MKNSGEIMNKLPKFENPFRSLDLAVDEEDSHSKVVKILSIIGKIVFSLRKVVLAIPVIYLALKLAAQNSEMLPLLVGIDLQTTGEFAMTISRQSAVMGPLMLTGGCLVLMFFSRKTIYPWLISLFSLAVPLLLLITNIYPS